MTDFDFDDEDVETPIMRWVIYMAVRDAPVDPEEPTTPTAPDGWTLLGAMTSVIGPIDVPGLFGRPVDDAPAGLGGPPASP